MPLNKETTQAEAITLTLPPWTFSGWRTSFFIVCFESVVEIFRVRQQANQKSSENVNPFQLGANILGNPLADNLILLKISWGGSSCLQEG